MNQDAQPEYGATFLRYRDQGDMDAFERILDAFHRPLFSYLMRMLKSREDAEDALQEVWAKVIRQRDSYKDQGKFSSWLYRIAHNHCLDQYRRKSTRTESQELVETDDGLQWLDIVSSEGHSPMEALEEQEQLQHLETAIEQLPERIREVYILRAVHDLPFKEIAGIQDSPLGTVLSRMSQAVSKLKQLLMEEQIGENERSNPKREAR